jgi:hypothetical protein
MVSESRRGVERRAFVSGYERGEASVEVGGVERRPELSFRGGRRFD